MKKYANQEDRKLKVVIGGAGPAGLTASYLLSKMGVASQVFEADKNVGGIAKTVEHNGFLFDLGGHRFFTKIKPVEDLWIQVMGESMPTRKRVSSIYYNKKIFDYPLNPKNVLTNMGLLESSKIFLSYLGARLLTSREKGCFEDYVSSRFGRRLYETFFKNYTEKIWGMPCSEINHMWASQRIKDMTFTSVAKSALTGSDANIRSLIQEFMYPDYGAGQMWDRMADEVESHGGSIKTQSRISSVNINADKVESVGVENQEGKSVVSVNHFISSLPLRDLILMINPTPPSDVLDAARKLKYREFIVVALILDEKNSRPENWIYVHDEKVKVGRIQFYNNWSPYLSPSEDKTCIGVEYFCNEGDGLWNTCDSRLVDMAYKEFDSLELFKQHPKLVDSRVVRVKKAYPVYDLGYRENLETVKKYIESIKNLSTIGRAGLHKYNNMDHSMLTAIYAVENIYGAYKDVWSINERGEYHEKKPEPA